MKSWHSKGSEEEMGFEEEADLVCGVGDVAPDILCVSLSLLSIALGATSLSLSKSASSSKSSSSLKLLLYYHSSMLREMK